MVRNSKCQKVAQYRRTAAHGSRQPLLKLAANEMRLREHGIGMPRADGRQIRKPPGLVG